MISLRDIINWASDQTKFGIEEGIELINAAYPENQLD